MKGIDIFCASQASTAICLSMDEPSSSSTIQLGGRAIDRHNPIIRDGRRAVPCSSQTPINPKSYHQLQKTKKASKPSSSNTASTITNTSNSSKQNEQKRKTSANVKSQAKLSDYIKTVSSSSSSSSTQKDHVIARKSLTKKAADLFTPPGSSRYLLGDTAFVEGLSDCHEPALSLVPFGNKNDQLGAENQEVSNSIASKQDSKQSSSSASSNQVVVLRVSLHCKGCEGKVRKHLSRMEGVTSFNIDFAAKKVTVVGDVTPVSVLASISKVKNAQFWTTGVSSVSPATPNLNLTTLNTIKQ